MLRLKDQKKGSYIVDALNNSRRNKEHMMAHCTKTCDSGKPRDQMEETQSIICEGRMGRIETEGFRKKQNKSQVLKGKYKLYGRGGKEGKSKQAEKLAYTKSQK